MKQIVVYPGTFDPITYGHIDLVKRASKMFDHIIVAVANNQEKDTLFSLQERIDLVKAVFLGIPNVEVDWFEGLLVDFVKQKGSKCIIRGLRAISDFDYEYQMASMNRKLVADLETVFLTPDDRYVNVASSLVRIIAKAKGDVSHFVPPVVADALNLKTAVDPRLIAQHLE